MALLTIQPTPVLPLQKDQKISTHQTISNRKEMVKIIGNPIPKQSDNEIGNDNNMILDGTAT